MQQIKFFLRAGSVKAVLVDEYNHSNKVSKISITKGMQAELVIGLFDGDGAESTLPRARHDFPAWDFWADVDYDGGTKALLRAQESIFTDDDGYIHIPINNTNTVELAEKLGVAETMDLKCELAGYEAGSTIPVFILQFEITVRNRVGDIAAIPPVEQENEFLNAAQTYALFAAANEIEYSADGADWHTTYVIGDVLMRYRNSAILNATWTVQVLPQGAPGRDGVDGENGKDGTDGAPGKDGKDGAGDMSTAVYDADRDGKIDRAKTADIAPWEGITGKPENYPPAIHTHNYTDLQQPTRLKVWEEENPMTLYLSHEVLQRSDTITGNVLNIYFNSIMTAPDGSAYTGQVGDLFMMQYRIIAESDITEIVVGGEYNTAEGFNLPSALYADKETWMHVFNIELQYNAEATSKLKMIVTYDKSVRI